MSNPNQPDDIKLIIISQKTSSEPIPQLDPLQQQLLNLKLTSNLLKQTSFNSTTNKLDYFEQLLHEQHNKFNKKLNKCISNQKELIKKMKTVQKLCRDVRNQSGNLNYAKVHVQLEELRATKEETNKYQKLSQGMLKYLEKIGEKLDAY